MRLRYVWALAILLCLVYLQACGNQNQDLKTEENRSEPQLSLQNAPIPTVPRRQLTKELTWYDNVAASIGIETSFAGVSQGVQTTIELTRNYKLEVWVFAPGEDDALVDEGTVFLNNSSEREFVYVCRYHGFLEFHPSLKTKVSIFGSGVSAQLGMRDLTSVIQTSQTFPIKTGDAWPAIIDYCRQLGEEKNYKASINRDLSAMTKGMIYHDAQNECVRDEHCEEWHHKMFAGVREYTVAECVQRENKTRFCALRAKKGEACPYFDVTTHTRLTPGQFEYACAKGLKCTVVRQGGWLKNWEVYSSWQAECR